MFYSNRESDLKLSYTELEQSKPDPPYRALTSVNAVPPAGGRTLPGNGRDPGLGVRDLAGAESH